MWETNLVKVPHRSEDELLAMLETWLAALGRKPTLDEIIDGGDSNLFAAYTLRLFRQAARNAVLDRLASTARSLGHPADELGNAVMRVFAGLARAWKLSSGEQAALLGLESLPDLEGAGGMSEQELPIGIIERVAMLLNIFEAINALLPEPSRADAGIRAANSHPLFAGRPAIAVMMTGLDGLRQVQRYLLAERWRN